MKPGVYWLRCIEKFNEFLDSLGEKFDDVKEEVGKAKTKVEVKKDLKTETT